MSSKRVIRIGNVSIGGDNPVAVQSMTNTDTKDTERTVEQILALEREGCEIIRVAAYDVDAARNIRNIRERIHIPLVADDHFDHRIAIAAMENGADKVRINPGNIGSSEKIKMVADAARMHHIPIRVGANTGSLAKKYHETDRSTALFESAMENVRVLESFGFEDIVVALKSSDVNETVKAYRLMDREVDYPFHVGITEAGGYERSIIKSSIGIGSLLLDGIGDTIRVSITGDPLLEIGAAKDILQFSGRRVFGPDIIACPTCGRTRIDLEALYGQVSELVKDIRKNIKIAVMGCVVNGPGEARGADLGIAGGEGEGVIFIKGEPVKKVDEEHLLDEFRKVLMEYIGEDK